jgi:hypothetical protein
MSRFDMAIKIIAEEFREECEERDCTIRELFKSWQFDTDDMREEFTCILNQTELSKYVTDDCEIFDDDGSIKTLKQLASAVKKYQF